VEVVWLIGQLVHVEPPDPVYLPCGHLTHSRPDSEAFPGVQAVHTPETGAEPAAHKMVELCGARQLYPVWARGPTGGGGGAGGAEGSGGANGGGANGDSAVPEATATRKSWRAGIVSIDEVAFF